MKYGLECVTVTVIRKTCLKICMRTESNVEQFMLRMIEYIVMTKIIIIIVDVVTELIQRHKYLVARNRDARSSFRTRRLRMGKGQITNGTISVFINGTSFKAIRKVSAVLCSFIIILLTFYKKSILYFLLFHFLSRCCVCIRHRQPSEWSAAEIWLFCSILLASQQFHAHHSRAVSVVCLLVRSFFNVCLDDSATKTILREMQLVYTILMAANYEK